MGVSGFCSAFFCPPGGSRWTERWDILAVLRQVLVAFLFLFLVEKVRGLIRAVMGHLVAAKFPPEHFEMAGIWVRKEKCRQVLGAGFGHRFQLIQARAGDTDFYQGPIELTYPIHLVHAT